MSRKMLIDAAHAEETRVVVLDGNRVEEFDFESATKRQIRGNIYLAKVTRVEPSLQAAFVEYGGNKHGFLAFNEIHPDYYQIPVEDRDALREAEAELTQPSDDTDDDSVDEEELIEEAARKRRQLLRKYKIQEVIKRRQVLLVQVAKEERGNKGAALTTYLSLAGRYCVLMPNTPRGGGISRKITNAPDRKRLKEVAQNLDVPQGMGLIVRTAGASRTKTEIKRDYDYLLRLWETIRQDTLTSMAPALIYEEGNLVKRAIRDLYDKDIEIVLVEGEEAYKEAKSFIRMLMPSHAKKVQHYKASAPLFLAHGVENQLEAIYSPVAPLRSGGYLVINPTEALVSVDVNSGRSTKERNIEQTALRTNIEAAEECARQMRLRDLAGLVVIDFIDMEENKNVRQVEKKMKDALKRDRARVQMGKISQFGLMEISRQRRRTSLVEGSTQECPHCQGMGHIRSLESSALLALRTLEEDGMSRRSAKVALKCPTDVALYLLNEKREHIQDIEMRFAMRISIVADPDAIRPGCELERIESRNPEDAPELVLPDIIKVDIPAEEDEDEAETENREETQEGEGGNRRRRRRRRRGRGQDQDGANASESDTETSEASSEEGDEDQDSEERAEDDNEDRPRKRRRRGRRGGRGRRRRGDEAEARDDQDQDNDQTDEDSDDDTSDTSSEPQAEPEVQEVDPLAVVSPSSYDDLSASSGRDDEDEEAREARRQRRPGRRPKAEQAEETAEAALETGTSEAVVETEAEAPQDEEAPKPKRRRRASKKVEAAESEADTADAPVEAETTPADAETEEKPKPKRRRRTTKKAEEATEASADTPDAEASDSDAEEKPKPKRRRRTTKKVEEAVEASEAPAEIQADAETEEKPKPKRRRRTTKKVEEAVEATSTDTAVETPAPVAEPVVEAEVKPEPAPQAPQPSPEAETASEVAPQAATEPQPAPEPVAAEVTPEAEPASQAEEKANEPKRKGWWQRSQKLFGLGE